MARTLGTVAGALGVLLAAVSAPAATLTFDFNNGTLQGWHNRVWDLSANGGSGGWVDLDPNLTTMPTSINQGALQPPSGDDNLFGNNGSQVDPVGGSSDNHLNTLWLRSPMFAPDGSGDLTVQMARGKAHGPAPANEAAVASAATNDGKSGWKGVLLRQVSSGAFVLAKPRTAEGDAMATVTFTAAELAPFVGQSCTLELINSERGGWGWLSMDNVSIPGVLRQANLEVAAPSIPMGGSTTATVTIPSGFNASGAVTAYLTNRNPSVLTLNGTTAPFVALTFAAGGPTSQTVTVAGTALGYGNLTVGCADLDNASAGLPVLPASGLVGRWLTGDQDLLDKSGFTPAGTHDGKMADSTTAIFSIDVPPVAQAAQAAQAYSLDLASAGGAMLIANSMTAEPGYQPTFDEMTAKQLTVAFWAKGFPTEWNPFISKYGENPTGWQVRRRWTAPVATFTLRGTGGEDDPFDGTVLIDDYQWHHFAAVWDSVTGTRKLYVDGKLSSQVPHDFGPMGLAKANYLTLGGRCNAGSASPGNLFAGQLFDVRIYAIALSGSAVQSIVSANTTAIVAQSDTTSLDLGQTGQVSVSIPPTANATAPVTVFVTNTTPAVASLAGAVANVATLIFPAGGPSSQTLTLTALSEGQAQLACAANGLASTSVSLKVYGPHLIGRWFTGSESLADASGFRPAATHDGTPVGNSSGLSFTIDTPPSKPGKAAQLDGSTGLLINNSSALDAGYLPTFDDLMARQFSLSFWAKGLPGTWNAFVSKRGDDAIGWQVRRGGGMAEAFTLRGAKSGNPDGVGSIAINDGQWHHFAAVWDGYAGTRKCYVDGILDPSVNITNDFAPMLMAPNHHLILGAREPSQVSSFPSPAIEGGFSGLLYDVQLYNYPLSASAVKDLAFVAAIKVIPAQRSLPAPQTMTVEVVLPAGANQTQPVTVQVRNETPAIASLSTAVNDVLTLTYEMGGSLTQQVTVAGIKDGVAKLTASGGGFNAGTGQFNVWADPGARLIGHWISGPASLAETSGFRPAGTHDALAVGENAPYLFFSADVPAAYVDSGAQSLDLTAGKLAVAITNSSSADLGYVETFDNQMANKCTIAFWAKGTPAAGWDPWLSKRGEDNQGFQVRRYSEDSPVRPTFTLRGTAAVDDPYTGATVDADSWHHYAATWDGATGVRTLYVDGKPVMGLAGDLGPMGLATADHLVLGGREQGGFGHFFQGLLFDVRIYSYALNPVEVGVLVNPPTTFSLALTPEVIPQNETLLLTVTVPAGATATAPLTVYLTNHSPSVVTIVGATENVYALTFPVGVVGQAVALRSVGPGQINITAGAAALGTASLTTINTVVAPKLVGHWLSGAADLKDQSGYTQAGTHDGVPVGANAAALVFSTDVPPGFQGQSLDLTANNATTTVGVIINNSATADPGYLPTFDTGISWAFSVALWAKGTPNGWDGFVSKRGEDGIGWQVRRSGGDAEAFTVRGTGSGNFDGVGSIAITDGKWHHFAAVWDGVSGTRKCYVDGVLDANINLVGDFGPMSLAPNHHLGIGAREQAGMGTYESWFSGKLCDVRLYNYPISAAEVAALAGVPAEAPKLTLQRGTGNQVRISWPTAASGYALYQSGSLTTGWTASSLQVTVEGAENVIYAPVSTDPQFFRLKK